MVVGRLTLTLELGLTEGGACMEKRNKPMIFFIKKKETNDLVYKELINQSKEP